MKNKEKSEKNQNLNKNIENSSEKLKKPQIKPKITKNMLLGELVQKYPDTALILIKEGIHCIGCGAAAFETIEQGLLLHGKSKKEIEELIKKLNRAANQ